MEIRPAVASDIDELCELTYRLWNESPEFSRVPFSWSHVRAHIKSRHFISVLEHEGHLVGMLGGMLFPTAFSPTPTAYEGGLYIVPEHRGGRHAIAMIKGFEAWAKHHGAKFIHAGTIAGIETQRVVKMYERLGFSTTGCSLTKEVL